MKKLEEMEYPGRGIIIGLTKKDEIFCSYFITGRSPPSQARKLVKSEGIISTEPTDPEILAKGNPDLLVYNAIAWYEDTAAISNGKQTDSIITGTLCGNLTLEECTNQWNYEPDANHTPRISGRIQFPYSKDLLLSELCIIKKGKENTIRAEYPLELSKPGVAYGITTYEGTNENPIPPFEGEPFTMNLKATSPRSICKKISSMLKPEFIVSTATIVFSNKAKYHILNFRGK